MRCFLFFDEEFRTGEDPFVGGFLSLTLSSKGLMLWFIRQAWSFENPRLESLTRWRMGSFDFKIDIDDHEV